MLAHHRQAAAVVLALVLVSCATAQPGTDKLVLASERVLKVAPSVYDQAMSWADRNWATLPSSTQAAFERIRTSFPPAYRAFDSSLQLYKAGKGGNLFEARDELDRLLIEANTLVVSLGGPNLLKAGGG